MSITVMASSHREWECHGLKNYGDFADKISEVNVRHFEDHSDGEWFFIDDELLPAMKGVDYQGQTPNERAIYTGRWNAYNSPGSDHDTQAEIYDMDDPQEVAAFEQYVKDLENLPETLLDDDIEDYDDSDGVDPDEIVIDD